MLNRLKIICALICIMTIQTTSAVFFTGEVLKKNNVTVIILGDIHMDVNPKLLPTEKQHTDLLKIAKKYDAFLIVEDIFVDRDATSRIKTSFGIKYHPKITRLTMESPLADLCKHATQQGIKNISSDCRRSEKAFKEAQDQIRNFNNSSFQTYFKNLESKRELSPVTDWMELNTVVEFGKALETGKYKLFIIPVGTDHMRPISDMIKEIFHFTSVLRKNTVRFPINRGILGDEIMVGASQEQNQKIFEKLIFIFNEYALNLPKFFKEALKAQPIRSRL